MQSKLGILIYNLLAGWHRNGSDVFIQSRQRDDDHHRQSAGDFVGFVDLVVVVRLHHEVQGSTRKSAKQVEKVFHQSGQAGHLVGHFEDEKQIRQRFERGKHTCFLISYFEQKKVLIFKKNKPN